MDFVHMNVDFYLCPNSQRLIDCSKGDDKVWCPSCKDTHVATALQVVPPEEAEIWKAQHQA